MNKFINAIKRLLPTKRRLIQLYAALLANPNIKGFATGTIYQGAGKNVCTPGLNCYSCPGAGGACPLGSLQNALSASGKTVPFYVFGIIILYGIIFGRMICGFFCPFGLIQDLLFKIKTPKIGKSRFTKVLSYLKYVILVLFVVIFPLMYAFRDFPLPGFCKYICPAGTLGGAIAMLIHPSNEGMFAMLGPLFTWKFAVLAVTVLLCIFLYRFFCRFICPLGALYGLFNRFSVLGIKLDKPKCTDCGRCISTCKMDISEVGDKDCISCGDCLAVCPTQAIRYRGGKILLPENEIPAKLDGEEREIAVKKRNRKRLVINITAITLALALLGGTLYYYNVYDKLPEAPSVESPDEGNTVGSLIYDYEFKYVMKNGTVKLSELYGQGKVVVINFWGTWCGPCKAELPDFDKVASELSDSVTVLTVHTSISGSDTPEEYITKNFLESKMLFVWDKAGANADEYYSMLGGKGAYPMTYILNEDGVITSIHNQLTYEQLTEAVENAKNN